MNECNKIKLNLKNNRSTAALENYKQYRNMFTKLINKTKTLYYRTKLNNNANLY